MSRSGVQLPPIASLLQSPPFHVDESVELPQFLELQTTSTSSFPPRPGPPPPPPPLHAASESARSHSFSSAFDPESPSSDDYAAHSTDDPSSVASLSSLSTLEARGIDAVRVRTRSSKPLSRSPSSPISHSSSPSKARRKQAKEKANRGFQAACLSRFEDFIRTYVGWERNEQSRGNGNGAGLHGLKINNLRRWEALTAHLVHREYLAALEHSRLDAFRTDLSAIMESAPAEEPYAGTFLFCREQVPCDHVDARSKACSVHGHPDWRECRRKQTDATFQSNLQLHLARRSAQQSCSELRVGGKG